jgi:hypothetical protein
MTLPPDLSRRRLLLASLCLPTAAGLPGCAAPLPRFAHPGSSGAARTLLTESAAAHGMEAFSTLRDVSVRYAGNWRPVVGRLQPALVDAGHRGPSEERMLLQDDLTAQAFTGPGGHKLVIRHSSGADQGEVRVWFDGEEAHDVERRAAAALVADGYGLFLFGPLLLAGRWSADRALGMELQGTEELRLDGREHLCDVLRIRVAPGLGFSQGDELALFIDRTDRLMRCVRFTLDGLESTRGAIAEVQTFDHVTLHGVTWPTRFYERLLRPLPLPVHKWRLTGLDVDRGLTVADVSGPSFAGGALAAATPLP